MSNTQLTVVNSRSTIVNGELINSNSTPLEIALKEAVVGAFMRAQGVKAFLSDEGVRIECKRPTIYLQGHDMELRIPAWKAGTESHEEWVKKANVAVRNFMVRASGYVHGDLRERVQRATIAIAQTLSELTKKNETEAGQPVESVQPNA